MNNKIILWAAKHKREALFLMLSLHLLLILNAAFIGKQLYGSGIILEDFWKYIIFMIFLVAFFFYPIKSKNRGMYGFSCDSKIFKYSLKRQKRLDLIISFSTFFILIFAANNYYAGRLPELGIVPQVFAEEAATYVGSETQANYIGSGVVAVEDLRSHPNHAQNVNKKNIIKKIFKKEKDHKSRKIIWAAVFAVLLCIVLTFGIAVLACAVYCSGAEVLGIMIFTGGAAGLLALSIWWVKRIIHKRETAVIELE